MASGNTGSNVWNRNLDSTSWTGSSTSKTSAQSGSISKTSNENSSAWTPSSWNVTNTTSVTSLKDVMSEQLSESSRKDKTWEERTRQRFVSSEPWYPGKVGRRSRNVGDTSVSKSNSTRQTSGKRSPLSLSTSSSGKDIYLEYDSLSKETGIQLVNVHKQDLIKIGFNSLAGWVKVPGHVYIGRDMTRYVPGAVGSKWHNPFKSRNCSREQICRQFKEYIRSNKTITENGKTLYQSLDELKGKTLGCWCHPERCHGHMLMELVSEVCGD